MAKKTPQPAKSQSKAPAPKKTPQPAKSQSKAPAAKKTLQPAKSQSKAPAPKKKPRPTRKKPKVPFRKVTIVNPPDDASGAAAFTGASTTYPATGTVQPMPASMNYQVIENNVANGAVNPIDVSMLTQAPGNNPDLWNWSAT